MKPKNVKDIEAYNHLKKFLETGNYSWLHMKKKEPGRNDLCSCGSGKKYKKCCLNKI